MGESVLSGVSDNRPRITAGCVAAGAIVLAAFTVVLATPLPRPLFADEYSLVVTDRDGAILRMYMNRAEQWTFPPATDSDIPDNLRAAVTTFEDRYFALHPGVNPYAIVRAMRQNLRSGRRVSGASTITMQLARLADPKPRTIVSKILEVFQALKIELLHSKDAVLAAYLENAPYGGNIRGYRTAAAMYFEKSEQELTWAEAATLAVLPNAPSLVSPVRDPAVLRERRDRLLTTLHQNGKIDADTLHSALAEPVPSGRIATPLDAPHLADRVRRELTRTGQSTSTVVRTSIDGAVQRTVTTAAERHATYLVSLGVQNVSALVVDTRTGEARAYVGSQNYLARGAGTVDGVLGARSTGSILKPFLYALAIDDGMMIAETMIPDIPSHFGAFTPQNPDESFRGLVSMRDALILSLNVPPARILAEYGLEAFHTFLGAAGITTLVRTASDYGLPMILGGVEATPWDVARIFRGLANRGEFGSITYLPRDASQDAPRLVSPGAALIVLDVLRDVSRPGVETHWTRFAGSFPIAWKTGTSYGQRDAWAVGVSPDWTIVVWAGNFTGEGNRNLTSTTGAGTLLFDIFNLLPKDPTNAWFEPAPEDFIEVGIVQSTGYRATRHTTDTVRARAPAGARPLAGDPYHTTIHVTKDGAFRVTSECWVPGEYDERTVVAYPPAIAQYLRGAGRLIRPIPPVAPDCIVTDSRAVAITYPTDGARIFLPRDLDGTTQNIVVRAAHRDGEGSLFWYLNDEYVGPTESDHTRAFELPAGTHTIAVIDRHGNTATASFHVASRVASHAAPSGN